MASYATAAENEEIAATADREIILQNINSCRTFPEQAQLQTCEPDRSQITDHLKFLTENFWHEHHLARTWGYIIIRTAYRDGDNEKFQQGIETIHRFLRLWSDRELQFATRMMQRLRRKYEYKFDWPEGMPETVNSTPNDCFLERFINDIVEDKDALNDATVPWVSDYFKRWAYAHWQGDPLHISAGSPRLKSCILLDAETLDQLQNAQQSTPGALSSSESFELGGRFWVKIVEAFPLPGVMGGADCYRLRLGDLADFWFKRTWLDPDRLASPVKNQPEDVYYYVSGDYGGSMLDRIGS
ncbi:hypothetical protein IFR04_010334 [Cadophora malorum]|uniref:Uncharacterized protein n=1 Tax=Cadophora malorum TaxID=108018 RepID=A0A8H7TCF0_9HELO|nr:hypothetical protein IFR04_010334 [Cadophora malorum]